MTNARSSVKRLVTAATAAIAGALLAAFGLGSGPVSAGGWSVISLDPGVSVIAGEQTEFGFTVLSHGTNPATFDDGLEVRLTAADGERLDFSAIATGAEGHHVATVEVPTAGTYRYEVTYEGRPLGMTPAGGTLEVAAPPSGGTTVAWEVAPYVLGTGAVAMGLAAVLDGRRTRRATPAPASSTA